MARELGNGCRSSAQPDLGSGKPYVVVSRNTKCQIWDALRLRATPDAGAAGPGRHPGDYRPSSGG
jgi:hypothetical protein